MPVIKPTCLRDLKLRINIADVVSRTVTLRRSGSRLKGLCPFHNEKTPSFHVNPDRGSFKCFGCGKSGDIIEFVRETEQLGFTEAVEALGQRFGIVIEYEEGAGPTREERSLRQELYDLHEQAADFYHEVFKGGTPAGGAMREYWAVQRRFPPELAVEFKVGAAPADDGGLAARLWKRNYSEEAVRQCGLFFVREGALFSPGALRPRFRGRLMIPIRDYQGRVVAFTARQTGLTPQDDPAREAKYVNSPETPIFTKGQLLFNLDRARTAVGEGRPFLMVEGQLDAMRCWQVGVKTAVAPQGTAITEGQLSLIRRYHPQIDCFFDSDAAGQKAALRLLPMAIKSGIEVRFLALAGAEKIDPDLLFLERGAAAYDELRKGAMSAMGFACRALLPGGGGVSPEQKNRAANAVLEIILAAESEVARSEYLTEAAVHLELPPMALAKDFERLVRRGDRQVRRSGESAGVPGQAVQQGPGQGGSAGGPPGSPGQRATPESDLLLLCLHCEALGKPLSTAFPHEWIDTRHPAGLLLNRFLAEFEQGSWPGRDHLDELLETQEQKSLVASLLFDPPTFDDPVKVAREGLSQMRARALEPRLREIELALAKTQVDSKNDAISLLKESLELQRQLRQPLVLNVAG
jgi:DNA primase